MSASECRLCLWGWQNDDQFIHINQPIRRNPLLLQVDGWGKIMLPTCLRSKKAVIPQSMPLPSKDRVFPQIGRCVVRFSTDSSSFKALRQCWFKEGCKFSAILPIRWKAVTPNRCSDRLSGTAFPNCRLGLSSYPVCPPIQLQLQSLGGGRMENMINKREIWRS